MVLIVDDEEVVSDITQRKPVLHNRDGSLWIGTIVIFMINETLC